MIFVSLKIADRTQHKAKLQIWHYSRAIVLVGHKRSSLALMSDWSALYDYCYESSHSPSCHIWMRV